MNSMGSVALFGAISYLLGAIPNGYLIAKAKGVDIRKVGSGNIGATNVFRSVSKTLGILTFVADALKGFVPAFVFPVLVSRLAGVEATRGMALLFGGLAIAGHNWPVYLGFKGGKGVATSAGALLGIVPGATGIAVLIWTSVFLLTRYVSVASITVAIALPAIAWLRYADEGILLPAVLTVLGALIVARHSGNIRRLIQGTENRFSFGKRGQTEDPTPRAHPP